MRENGGLRKALLDIPCAKTEIQNEIRSDHDQISAKFRVDKRSPLPKFEESHSVCVR